MHCDHLARKAYKRQAKRELHQGLWGAIGAVLLLQIPTVILSVVYQRGMEIMQGVLEDAEITLPEMYDAFGTAGKYMLFFMIASVLFISPLQFGMKHYFVARARMEKEELSMVLCCFFSMKKYTTALLLQLCIMARTLGWTLLLIVASMAAGMCMAFGTVLGIIALLAMIVFAVYIFMRIRCYDGAYICLIDVPGANPWRAVGSCSKVFRGHLWELFCFEISFVLWYLLGVITLGAAMIYLQGYRELAFIHYFDALCCQPPENQ